MCSSSFLILPPTRNCRDRFVLETHKIAFLFADSRKFFAWKLYWNIQNAKIWRQITFQFQLVWIIYGSCSRRSLRSACGRGIRNRQKSLFDYKNFSRNISLRNKLFSKLMFNANNILSWRWFVCAENSTIELSFARSSFARNFKFQFHYLVHSSAASLATHPYLNHKLWQIFPSAGIHHGIDMSPSRTPRSHQTTPQPKRARLLAASRSLHVSTSLTNLKKENWVTIDITFRSRKRNWILAAHEKYLWQIYCNY